MMEKQNNILYSLLQTAKTAIKDELTWNTQPSNSIIEISKKNCHKAQIFFSFLYQHPQHIERCLSEELTKMGCNVLQYCKDKEYITVLFENKIYTLYWGQKKPDFKNENTFYFPLVQGGLRIFSTNLMYIISECDEAVCNDHTLWLRIRDEINTYCQSL